jgi:hypothetical protein
MKKLFVALLAVAGLTACFNEEVVRVQDPTAISFEANWVENATRANEAQDPSTTTESLTGFNVWGFIDSPEGKVFEAEDVAQLVAEVTGEDVEVEADENSVVFTVGDYDYTVEPEGTEEILEASTKVLRGKKPVSASSRTRRPGVGTRPRRPVSASTRRPARKVSK